MIVEINKKTSECLNNQCICAGGCANHCPYNYPRRTFGFTPELTLLKNNKVNCASYESGQRFLKNGAPNYHYYPKNIDSLGSGCIPFDMIEKESSKKKYPKCAKQVIEVLNNLGFEIKSSSSTSLVIAHKNMTNLYNVPIGLLEETKTIDEKVRDVISHIMKIVDSGNTQGVK